MGCPVVGGEQQPGITPHDETIRVWDATSRKLLRVMRGHTYAVFSLAVSNGKLFSGSNDNSIRVWAN